MKDRFGYEIELIELNYPCPNCSYPHALAMDGHGEAVEECYVAWCPCGCFWSKDAGHVIVANRRDHISNWWLERENEHGERI